MTAYHPARDKDEAIRDLDYVIRLSQRHQRLYNRVAGLMRFLELLGGSAGIAVAISGSPSTLKIAGAILAVIACANFAFDPSGRARDHLRTGQDYRKVRARVAELDQGEIDRRRNLVSEPDYIEGLRAPSWNEMMRTHGFATSVRPLSWWERFVAAIA